MKEQITKRRKMKNNIKTKIYSNKLKYSQNYSIIYPGLKRISDFSLHIERHTFGRIILIKYCSGVKK